MSARRGPVLPICLFSLPWSLSGYRYRTIRRWPLGFRNRLVRTSLPAPTRCAWLGIVVTATERFLDVNGVRLRVYDAGPSDGPLVILAHGFPELAFSWRHQIPVLAAAGYRVLAPDQRGYGGSARPERLEAYDINALTGDLVGLVDAAGAERAALVGHDWGAVVTWSTPLLHPQRIAAVAGLSLPPDLRRQLLLHPVLPAARGGRRRDGGRPPPGDAADAGRYAGTRGRGGGAADAGAGTAGIH
jgi:pimeloyl-ACP methyl ester carboxylesterase